MLNEAGKLDVEGGENECRSRDTIESLAVFFVLLGLKSQQEVPFRDERRSNLVLDMFILRYLLVIQVKILSRQLDMYVIIDCHRQARHHCESSKKVLLQLVWIMSFCSVPVGMNF